MFTMKLVKSVSLRTEGLNDRGIVVIRSCGIDEESSCKQWSACLSYSKLDTCQLL